MKGPQEYKDRVQQEFNDWYRRQTRVTLTMEEMNHVISIGVSILHTMDGGPQGGSFVQAIVKNDLSGSHNRADSTNSRVIPFYVTLKDNYRSQ